MQITLFGELEQFQVNCVCIGNLLVSNFGLSSFDSSELCLELIKCYGSCVQNLLYKHLCTRLTIYPFYNARFRIILLLDWVYLLLFNVPRHNSSRLYIVIAYGRRCWFTSTYVRCDQVLNFSWGRWYKVYVYHRLIHQSSRVQFSLTRGLPWLMFWTRKLSMGEGVTLCFNKFLCDEGVLSCKW